jgi:CHAT domain-containing protein
LDFAKIVDDQGAQSVLATLWSVNDPSTSELMGKFYALHESSPNMTKAEALREAQLTLLHGDKSALHDDMATKAGDDLEPAPNATNRSAWAAGTEKPASGPNFNRDYTHPYYWAPFILMGNWK